MDNRLNGADLYVVRQAWRYYDTKKKTVRDSKEVDGARSLYADPSAVSPPECSPAPPMSLYDELKCKVPRPLKIGGEDSLGNEQPLPALSSRPCYRCIS
jgi:hypothetical protein